jgi:leader peptidase (prepilin peptidase)/N-methyltransferase
VRPASRCPRCGRGLAWYENIPVLSWLILRGRCRGCSLPISVQYPLIELATAVVWGWFFWRYGINWTGLAYATLVTLLLGIAMTDAREYIIPHEFTYGGMALGLLFGVGYGPAGLVSALQGMIFGAGILYLIGAIGGFIAGRDAMGGGDVAMMAMVGAFLGWESVCATLFLGSCIGVLLHLITLALGRRGAKGSTDDASTPSPVIAGSPSDAEFKSRDQLKREGYIPFGVSLALAAALIAVTDGRAWLTDWVASYAAFIGL